MAIYNYTYGDNIYGVLDSDTGDLIITGSGEMYSFQTVDPPSFSQRTYVKRIIIENGITLIGRYAFFNHTSLIGVQLPNTLIKIDWSAFKGCTSLPSIVIPASVTTLDEECFRGCTSLTSITSLFQGNQSVIYYALDTNATDPKVAYCSPFNTGFISGATTEGYTILNIPIDYNVQAMRLNQDGSYDNIFYKTKAEIVDYNNTQSGLIANNVQDSIDELQLKKSPLASPTFTGTPLAPTPTTGDSSTKIATTAFVSTAIANLDLSADNVTYDNTTSGLSADDVQGAIDELQTEKVSVTRTVNSKALSSDITISQTDVGGAEILLKSESYTLSLTDNYKLNKCLSASTITVTIPLNSVVAFPVGSEIVLARYGAGAVTLSATSGVTLYSSDSKKSINKQYEAVTLKKIATDEWLLIGSLA